MQVAELEGLDLDYWVFRAEHPETQWTRSDWESQSIPYSLSWQWGGPIIEREKIILVAPRIWAPELWLAIIDEHFDTTHGWHPVEAAGQIPLVAAMRAFVSRKFGAEVEDLPNGIN